MRSRLLVPGSCAMTALLLLAGARPAAQATSAAPKLIVLAVVDQMRADYLERYKAQIATGFKRLVDEGVVFTEAYYPYASTETAQGHATMLSGQSPAVSGIVGDTWYDRASKTTIVAGDSAHHKLVEGVARGGSPEQLLVHALGDAMKQRDPKTLVMTASWKRYSALLMGGQHADAAYWFDSASGHFVTSDYYMRAYPAWVSAFNGTDPTAKYFGQTWLSHRFNNTTDPSPTPAFRDALRGSPYPNEILLDFATKMLGNTELGQDSVPDVMAISFSALDFVGHTYGPETPEFDDTFKQLDRQVGALLQALDDRVGRGNWTLALVADHGAALLPEKMKERGEDAGRIDPRALYAAIIKELSPKFPDAAKLIAAVEIPEFYVDYAEGVRRGIEPAALEAAVADAARKQPGIAQVYTRSQIMAAGPNSEPFLRAVANGFNPARSGDVFMIQKPNYLFWGGSGTTHGSPYDYDQHVPLIFIGRGIAKGTRADRVLINDLAPTLANIAGVEMPGVPGHVLQAALATASAASR